MRRHAKGWLIGTGTVLAVFGALVWGLGLFRADTSSPQAAAPQYLPGSVQVFRFLASQSSNYCGLRPGVLSSYSNKGRLEGACCNPMDLATYRAQVQQLERYRDIWVIPTDPYNVAVPVAKTLLGYDSSIRLTSQQQAVYDQAMKMTPDKGPCCCRCWRWDADAGLAKYLITSRHFGARQVASVVWLMNGCGGRHSAGLSAT